MKNYAWTGALSALALFVLWRYQAAREARADAEIAALKQTTQELAKVSQGAVVPAHIVVDLPQVVVRAEQAPAAPLGSPPPAKVPTGGASSAEMRATYQATLEAESVDPNWSKGAVRQLHGIFDQLATRASAVKSVECRHTLCRAELSHDTAEDSRTFMDQWMMGGARLEWKGMISGGVVESNAGAPVRTVFYFVREGADPPALD